MADLQSKYIDNIDGKYYVDQECIDCDLCVYICPIEVLETVNEA